MASSPSSSSSAFPPSGAQQRLATRQPFAARVKRGSAVIVVCLAALVSLALPLALTSDAQAEARHASLIIDANTGNVLHAQAADEPRHPASLTKMMTLYMVFELIEMGRLSYNTPIKVTAEAAAAAPSKLELEPGETILLIDAIKALVTKSANDMAIAIAMHVGGSEQNFARLMTEKARQIGMRNTLFRNASGLPDPEQVTTARDMVTLGLHLQDDFPKHYPLFGLRSFTYNGGSYRNHNTLLLSYRGTDGIKTGYTRASGFNLVANVRRDGRHVIGAIFGGETAAARNAHLRMLFDRTIPRASTERTRKAPSSPLLVAKRSAPKPTQVARAEPAPAAPAPVKATRPAAAAPVAAKSPAAEPAAPAPVAVAKAAPPPPPAPRLAPHAPVPAPAPAAAAAPEAPAVEQAEAPAAAEPPAAAPVEEAAPAAAITVAAAEPAAEVAPAPEPAAGPAIAVAKVRRVMVAPHVSRPAVAVAETEPSATAGSASPKTTSPFAVAALNPGKFGSRLPAEAQPAVSNPARAQETVIAKSAATADGSVRAPSTFEAQVAALAANVTMPSARHDAAVEPQAVATVTAPAKVLGQPPSTLDAQADAIGALARGEPLPAAEPQRVAAAEPLPPPTYRLKGPIIDAAVTAPAAPVAAAPRAAPAPVPGITAAQPKPARVAAVQPAVGAASSPGGAFQIQIGAFSSAEEAEKRLGTVQAGSQGVLKGHAPITLPVAKSNRTLYRARFASFDANSAAAACLELRRRQVDCFVMKGE